MTEVLVFNTHRRYRVSRTRIAGIVRRTMGRKNARISIIFISSRKSRIINRTYLRHDYVTDVVTFCLETSPVLEGEIYVNLDRARQQAGEYQVSVANETARLVIHGCLHLLGYDDATEAQRRVMKRVEDRYLAYWFAAPQRKEAKRT